MQSLEGGNDFAAERDRGWCAAVATVVHVAPDAEAALDSVRAASPKCNASAWDGMLIVRMLAADSASLRAAVIAVLCVMSVPKVPPLLVGYGRWFVSRCPQAPAGRPLPISMAAMVARRRLERA
jgi:hypothetical protein